MSTLNRNSILRSMGAEPKKEPKKKVIKKAPSSIISSKSNQINQHDRPSQVDPNEDSTPTSIQESNELDQVQKELDNQRRSSTFNPTPKYITTSSDSITNADDNDIIPIQSKSSVVPPDEVLSRKDPVARTQSQIQSRNLNLPPLASENFRKSSGSEPKSSLGKSSGGKLSKIFSGKKNQAKDVPPVRDVRMKRYSHRQTSDLDNENVLNGNEEQDGSDSKFIWANHPEPIPEKERIRSYRKPGAVVDAEPLVISSQAPQIKEDVVHQERINLVDEGVENEEIEGETEHNALVEEKVDSEQPKAQVSAAAPLAATTAVGAAGAIKALKPSTPPNVSSTKTAQRQEAARASKPGKRSDKVSALTPEQRHYLLKALVNLQLSVESAELEKLGALTQYGFPFALQRPKNRIKDEKLDNEFSQGGFEEAAEESYADEDQARRFEDLKEPLIFRQMFHVNLRNFPGLDEASAKYWQERIQTFLDEISARNFSTSLERSEMTKRHLFAQVIIHYLGVYFSRGFGVRGEGELKGPGPGLPGSDTWGGGKKWGKGTVKRGLDKPIRLDEELMKKVEDLFGSDAKEAKVWKLAGEEVRRVKKDWSGFKESIIEKETGLEEIQQFLEISTVKNLPPHLKNSVEYARIQAAYLLRSLFVDNGDGPFNVLKGIHSLFPYWGARQLLLFANASTLISGILSLLLSRPLGAKSLVQRVISFVLGGEMATIQKEYIKPLKSSINDDELCETLEAYVKRGKRAEGKTVRARAEKDGDDVLTTILLYSSSPVSSDRTLDIKRMQKAFAGSPLRGDINLAYPKDCLIAKELNPIQIETLDRWNGNGAEKSDALKFAQLKLLLRETLKVRDREQAIKVASGSLIVNIIKDSLELVFYQPIRTIAATADLSGRLGDLQAFIDDLINVKKSSTSENIEDWIALCARHENSLYFLFHETVSISKPFFDWAQVGCDYMAMSTTDPAHPADRKVKNVEINLEELLRDDRIKTEDIDLILKEVDQLTEFTLYQKVRNELEMRKNFLLAKEEGTGKSGLSQDDIPSERMRKEVLDIDGLLSKLMKDARVKINSGGIVEGGRGTEQREFPWAWFDHSDLYGQSIPAEKNQAEAFFNPSSVSAENPQLFHIRKLLPAFQDHLSSLLPDWKDGDKSGPKPRVNFQKDTNRSSYAPSVAPSSKSKNADARSTKSGKGGLRSFFRRS